MLSYLLAGFIDMAELIEHTQYNYGQWKTLEDQGIHTLNDITAAAKHLTSYKKPVANENQ